eukprot:GILK01010218.1.p1 GENE.GILK01010218.1~~GILK01010218.1.p1  ORF type:complete len:288 (+),score=-3.38 GILK01010218.1:83-946(+)
MNFSAKWQSFISCANDVDGERYPSDCEHIDENIDLEENKDADSRLILDTCCDCMGDCNNESFQIETCACRDIFGSFPYNKDGTLNTEHCMRLPIVECGPACSCSSSCINRLSQRGITADLQLFKHPFKGWGVRCTKDIPMGRFICQYAGEIISREEATRRRMLRHATTQNYIMNVREHVSNQTYLTLIDPTNRGNVGRYLNHSCAPNLSRHVVRLVGVAVPKVCFFTSRHLEAGEELCFDYADIFAEQHVCPSNASTDSTAATTQFTKCFCGTSSCKGYLPCDPSAY